MVVLNKKEELNRTPDLNLIPAKVFPFVTVTLIAYLRIISLKFHLKTYNVTHKLDVICLSETYLDSSISNDDDNLEIPGYDLFRADHPSSTKRSDVSIYYRSSLPLKILDIQYLEECIR